MILTSPWAGPIILAVPLVIVNICILFTHVCVQELDPIKSKLLYKFSYQIKITITVYSLDKYATAKFEKKNTFE